MAVALLTDDYVQRVIDLYKSNGGVTQANRQQFEADAQASRLSSFPADAQSRGNLNEATALRCPRRGSYCGRYTRAKRREPSGSSAWNARASPSKLANLQILELSAPIACAS